MKWSLRTGLPLLCFIFWFFEKILTVSTFHISDHITSNSNMWDFGDANLVKVSVKDEEPLNLNPNFNTALDFQKEYSIRHFRLPSLVG